MFVSTVSFIFLFCFFFFNDTATTEIYTLSLHDALPISAPTGAGPDWDFFGPLCDEFGDRKSTRLNSSHVAISYAVFCLKKKKNRCKVFGRKRRNMYVVFLLINEWFV